MKKTEKYILFILAIILVLILNFPHYSANIMVESDAKLSNDCSQNFTITGEKNVRVYMCDRKLGGDKVIANAVHKGNVIRIKRDEIGELEEVIILHELGHILGYKHQDSGIMEASPTNSYRKNLTKIEKDIASSFDGVRIIEWDNKQDIKYMQGQAEKYERLQPSVKYLVGKECTSIYYTDEIYQKWWSDYRLYNVCID